MLFVWKWGALKVPPSNKAESLQPQGKCKKAYYRIDGANKDFHPEVGQPYAFALLYDAFCLLLVVFQYLQHLGSVRGKHFFLLYILSFFPNFSFDCKNTIFF